MDSKSPPFLKVSFKDPFFLLLGFVLGVILTIYWNNLPQFLTGASEHLLTIFHQLAYYLGAALLILSPFYLYYRIKYGKDWATKVGIKLVAGKGLMASTKKLVNEVQTRQLQTDTVVEVGVNIFWRFTRIGLIGLSLAIIPIWLLINQNELLKQQNQKFDIQNERINLQNNLVEADRRGSLVLLMSNIIDQVNAEIEKQKPMNPEADTLPYKLSDPLIGRIAALSQSLLPYRYLVGDTLSEREVSFERGQLLLALVNSKLAPTTMTNINVKTNFSFSYLPKAKIYGANLNLANIERANFFKANLSETNLVRANLRHSNLEKADLRQANLDGTDLSKANLEDASLYFANLSGAKLFWANLKKVNLGGANLEFASLGGANLKQSNLSAANLKEAKLFGVNLEEASLYGARGLNLNQLRSTKSLFKCKGIEKLTTQLKKEKPCLFTKEGCPTQNN